MADPTTELERLQALEYAGEQAAHASTTVACCPVCYAVLPDDRPRWHGEPDRLAGAEHEPGGPRHAPGCWLDARIKDLVQHE